MKQKINISHYRALIAFVCGFCLSLCVYALVWYVVNRDLVGMDTFYYIIWCSFLTFCSYLFIACGYAAIRNTIKEEWR